MSTEPVSEYELGRRSGARRSIALKASYAVDLSEDDSHFKPPSKKTKMSAVKYKTSTLAIPDSDEESEFTGASDEDDEDDDEFPLAQRSSNRAALPNVVEKPDITMDDEDDEELSDVMLSDIELSDPFPGRPYLPGSRYGRGPARPSLPASRRGRGPARPSLPAPRRGRAVTLDRRGLVTNSRHRRNEFPPEPPVAHADDDDDDDNDDDDIPDAAAPDEPRHVMSWQETREYRLVVRANNSRKRLEANHPELLTMWKDLENLPKIPPTKAEQPPNISRELKPFQLEGLNWMKMMEKTQWGGGLLGDEMGMGKTIQAVSLIMSDYPAKNPSLVLIPPVALMQWQQEIAQYTDGTLKTFVYHGTNSAAKGVTVATLRKYDVILMSYNSLESLYRFQEKGRKRKEETVFQKSPVHQIQFHRVILDEAHNIKVSRFTIK